MKALELTNKRCDKLKVLKKSKHQKKGQGVLWDCICDCGKECTALAFQINKRLKQSCGCKLITNLTGQSFGELTAIERLPKTNSRTKYLCQCSCGKEITYEGSKLKKRTSCGCQNRRIRPRKPIKEVVGNSLLNSYIGNAKNRGIPFLLSKKRFYTMIFDKCYYCGDGPKTLFRKWRKEEGCKYNGIDRKDNTLGYTLSNCVSCCKECNYKKRAQHIDDFIQWIVKVSNNMGVCNSSIARLDAKQIRHDKINGMGLPRLIVLNWQKSPENPCISSGRQMKIYLRI